MPIDLWGKGLVPHWDASIDQKRPSVTPFHVQRGRGAVIVCPGGGYSSKAPHEGAPIAEMINSHGVNAFTLDYRVAPYRHPAPLCDAQRAIRYVRHNADELGVRPDKIAILGFSAGGHLTCSAATHYDAGNPIASDPVERVSCRPDAFIPCYAVVSFIQFQHGGSASNLLGDELDTKNRRLNSPDEHVTPDTPPAFIWHTAEDQSVPVENSLLLASALSRCGVPFALHIFPKGRHGIGLGTDNALARQWPVLLGAWLKEQGF